jgi:hypothetical protein
MLEHAQVTITADLKSHPEAERLLEGNHVRKATVITRRMIFQVPLQGNVGILSEGALVVLASEGGEGERKMCEHICCTPGNSKTFKDPKITVQ